MNMSTNRPRRERLIRPRAVLALAVFWVAALLMAGPAIAALVDRIVAIVNDDPILLSDLEEAMQPLRHKLRQEGYSDAQQGILLADKRIEMLEQLINEKLTDQRIQAHGITISPEEIDATIARIREVNQLTEGALRQMLEMDGLSYENYREQIEEQLLRQRLVNREIKSKIVITEKEIRDYYDKHSDQYAGQTKLHLRHLLLRVAPNASEQAREAVLQRIRQIHKRLESGESFEQLAENYSEAQSAQKGGDLGVFEERLLSETIVEALKGLDKGQFTDIVDTENGYQIFFVEDVIRSGGRPYEQVKAEIEDKLYADLLERNFRTWLNELRQQAHIEIIK